MAKFRFLRGKNEKIKESKSLRDGQILIGTMSDQTFVIYMDMKTENGELVRLSLDLSEYKNKIEELEKKIKTLEDSLLNLKSQNYLIVSG